MIEEKNHHTQILAGQRIGLFGKGGAGKSTITVLLARVLQKRGYQVILLDADSTNLGLWRALGIDQPPEPLMDYFGGMVFQGGQVTCPVDDPTPLENAELNLPTLPKQYCKQNKDGVILMTAGKIGDKGPGAGCDGPVSKIARDVSILDQNKAQITLIDFKAGFEDSARGVITSLDWALVVIDPTIAAIEMAVSLRDLVKQVQAQILPSTAHLESAKLVDWANQIFLNACIQGVLFIVNGVQNTYIEEQLIKRLSKKGIDPIGVIHEDPAIAIAWLEGKEVGTPEALGEIEQVVDGLEKAERDYRSL